ncbi:MAG TPA: hypothetical protein VGA99_14280, partial [bacterium]
MKTRQRVIAHLFRILIVAMLWLPLVGRAQDTIILGGWWFDSNAEKFLKNDGIVISGGVFTEVNAGLKSYIVLSGVSIIEL